MKAIICACVMAFVCGLLIASYLIQVYLPLLEVFK